MPVHSRVPAPENGPELAPEKPKVDTPAVSNQAVQDSLKSGDTPDLDGVTDPQDVVLYLTLNNVTHNTDEIPETMSALKQAEDEGLGHREVLPISDPYWSKDGEGEVTYDEGTYGGVFGEEAADRVEWWHGDEELAEGQVRVGGEVLTLGTEYVEEGNAESEAMVVDGWKKTVMALGMDETTADALCGALFKQADGSFRMLDSGAGATNELVQFAMAMYKAEQGQMDVRSVVFSGHHWDGEYSPDQAQGIWGEVAGQDHVYDDTADYFSLVDMARMKDVFPNAYAGVKSVQLAACNTDQLAMVDSEGNAISTNQFLQDTFENIEVSSYWKSLAPLAKDGAETNGEFQLDAMRIDGDRSDAAAKDSRHNAGGLKRSLPNDEGVLEEIRMKTNSASYTPTADGLGGGGQWDGLRDQNKAYSDRDDLSEFLFQAESGPAQAPAGGE
ncbi:MAG: hypothetical protein ACI8PZ_003426 [Myxococcota bacterium]|jgi:hypothetical protein